MDTKYTQQIQKEKRYISKYSGSVIARTVLLFFLFICIPFLARTSLFLFIFFLLFPPIFSSILTERSKSNVTVLLESCAKKFNFTFSRYRAENITKNFIIFSLVVWQVVNNQRDIAILLQLIPGILLLIYILSTMIATMIMRNKIHKYYMNFSL